jgi:hypothetical protein
VFDYNRTAKELKNVEKREEDPPGEDDDRHTGEKKRVER